MAKGSTGGRTRICCVFPGQGSRDIKIGADIFSYISAGKIFEIGRDILGYDVRELGEKELGKTSYFQSALFLDNAAHLGVLRNQERFRNGHIVSVGHSLGEWNAAYAGRCFGDLESEKGLRNALEKSVRLVKTRGELTSGCIPEKEKKDKGSHMVVVISENYSLIDRVCKEVTDSGEGLVEVANINSSRQRVISGNKQAVRGACEELESYGEVRNIISLSVEVPFHSSIMKSASEGMRKALENVVITPPIIPYIDNYTAGVVDENSSPEEIKKLLANQISGQVLWQESIERAVREFKVGTFVECGSGNIQKGIIKHILRDLIKSDKKYKGIKVFSFEEWMKEN